MKCVYIIYKNILSIIMNNIFAMNSTISIIMINIGNYEYYREFNDLPNKHKVDWFYFTDNNIESSFWNIININKIEEIKNLNNRMKTKYIKMNTHKILSDYEYYFIIDASFPISNKNFINDLFNILPQKLMVYLHNSRRKERNIKNEVIRCSKLKSVNKDKLKQQLKDYLDDNYPDKNGVLYSCGIILKQNNENLNKMMELWYKHNILYTSRDQISFPYLLWEN